MDFAWIKPMHLNYYINVIRTISGKYHTKIGIKSGAAYARKIRKKVKNNY